MEGAKTRPNTTSRAYPFGSESEEELLEETIREWRARGPAAAWQAIYNSLDWWFEARDVDPETQKVDRTHIEVHRVPWLETAGEHRILRRPPMNLTLTVNLPPDAEERLRAENPDLPAFERFIRREEP
jgi:hypothetical protein